MSYKDKAGDVPAGEKYPPLPCRQCGHLTPIPTLNSYGALCGPCYAHYCRYGPTRRPYVESATVRDMKTRLRPGFKFPPIQGAA